MIPIRSRKSNTRNKNLRSAKNRRSTRRRLHRNIEALETRRVLASLAGQVWDDANENGILDTGEPGFENVLVYLDANDNGAFDAAEASEITDSLGQYSFSSVAAGDYVVRIQTGAGIAQTAPRAFYGTGDPPGATGGGQNVTSLFVMDDTGQVSDLAPIHTPAIDDLVRVESGRFFGVNAEVDSIYELSFDSALAPTTNANVDLFGGMAYDAASDTIYLVGRDATTTGTFHLYTLDQSTSLVSSIGSGFDQLTSVADLAFDSINNRIVGFDDTTDNFFEFQPDGTGAILGTATQPLSSRSLAFDGTRFIMFNDGDAARTEVLEVNPDTGAIATAMTSSLPKTTEGLVYSTRGDVANRVMVSDIDALTDLNFGVFGEVFQGSGGEIYLNELLINPVGGDILTDQYIELRGPENAVIAPGTYLVAVSESNSDEGSVRNVIDLSSATFGANGFLVLLPDASPYVVNAGSNVLQSNTAGFGGLPGNRFSTSSTTSDIILNSGATYMLLESGTPPVVGDDIDSDDNGTADLSTVFGQWDVLESISLQPNGLNQAYGDLVVINGDPSGVVTQPGAETVVAAGFGYAGRIGDSLGNTADDWVFGTARNASPTGAIASYRLGTIELSGSATPAAFNGRDLDHVGKSNFVGAVRGIVVHDPLPPVDPAPVDPLSNPAAGVTVLADSNNNGRVDELTFTVDPDDFADGSILTNALEGVTFTEYSNGRHNGDVFAADVTGTNRTVFAALGIGATTYDTSFDQIFRVFRADFYRPAKSASIEVISGGQSTVFRFEAYDANNQLLGSTVSRDLLGSTRETLTLSFANEQIDHVIAYATPSAGAMMGTLGTFSYTQLEATAVSDANGLYEIPMLYSGSYDVTYINDPANAPLYGAQPVGIDVVMYDNYFLGPNISPETSDLEITLDENTSPSPNVIGTVVGTDADGSHTFQVVSGQQFGIVVDQSSGDLTVASNANLDFEVNPQFDIEVAVIDNLGASAIAVVSVTLRDVNERPTVLQSRMSVRENTSNGTAIGQIQGSDQDAGQSLTYSLAPGSGNAFSVDPVTGVVAVNDTSQIDFESRSVMSVRVRITDDDPAQPLFFDYTQFIDVLNANDAPVITSAGFVVFENSAGVIDTVRVADPDVGQTHTFQLIGGSNEALGLFSLSLDGTLSIINGAEIDFDTTPSHTLDILVSDSGTPSLTDSRSIVITVNDINELPSFQELEVSIGENTLPGEEVAVLVLDDPENHPTDHTIQMLPTDDSADFVFDSSNNRLTLAPGVTLDFESDPVKNLEFRIRDNTITNPSLSNSIDVNFTVNITDENDTPFLVTDTITVSEDAAPGDEVGLIRVGDFDAVDSYTIAVTGGTGASDFDLSSDGIVTVAANANLDADVLTEPLRLEVEFTDGAGATANGTVLVRLNDVNEQPVFDAALLAEVPSRIVSSEPFTYVIPEGLAVDPEGAPVYWAIFDPNLVGTTGEPDALPPWLDFDPETRTLNAFPEPTDTGSVDLVIRAYELGFREQGTEGPPAKLTDIPLNITIELGDKPLTNGRDRRDVDNNRVITASDALRVINYMNNNGSGAPASVELAITEPIETTNPLEPTDVVFALYVDVNGDGFVTPTDALIVINGIGTPYEATIPAEGEDFFSDMLSDREDAMDAALADYDTPSLF